MSRRATGSASLIPHLPGGSNGLSGGRAINIDGNTLDPSVQMMLAAQRATGVNGLASPTTWPPPGQQLRETARTVDEPAQSRPRYATCPSPVRPDRSRCGTTGPPAPGPAPWLVFYHGGGWVIGDLDTHDPGGGSICRDAGVHVLSVDYRLAPEHRPRRRGRRVRRRCGVASTPRNWAPTRPVAVGGDSAGGNLAALVTLRARDAGAPSPALQWLIYPATDIRGLARSRTLFGDGFR